MLTLVSPSYLQVGGTSREHHLLVAALSMDSLYRACSPASVSLLRGQFSALPTMRRLSQVAPWVLSFESFDSTVGSPFASLQYNLHSTRHCNLHFSPHFSLHSSFQGLLAERACPVNLHKMMSMRQESLGTQLRVRALIENEGRYTG